MPLPKNMSDDEFGMDVDEEYAYDEIEMPVNPDEINYYSTDEFFTLLCRNETIEIHRIHSFDFFTDVFNYLKDKWLDDAPDLKQTSYYKWLLHKISDDTSETDDELPPLKIEEMFDGYIVGLLKLFKICRTTPDENREVYISDDDTGIERRELLSRIFDVVKLSKDYMIKHAMLTHHINSVKFSSLTQQEKRINMISDTTLKPHQVVESYILDRLEECGYKHHKSCCYERVVSSTGVKTFAWARKMKISQFIPHELTAEKNYSIYKLYTNSPSYNMNKTLSTFFTEDSHQSRFPALNPNRSMYSCRNGIWHTGHLAFYDYKDQARWPEITKRKIASMIKYDPRAAEFVPPSARDTCLKHYDIDFKHGDLINNCDDIMDIDCNKEFYTPDLDNVLSYQRLDQDTIDNVYALLGRLFYDTRRHDDMQLLLFFKGVAGSGKSSVLNLITECFDKEAIGTLNSNCQDQFSLEHLTDVDIVITYEAKRNMKFDQAVLQQCVSGERTTVVKKGVKSEDMLWRAPFVMAGNELPAWRDAAGSMARRLALIPFNHRVVQQDEELGDRMLKDVLTYITKMTLMYRQMVIRSKKKGFWSVRKDGTTLASAQLIAVRDEIIADLQPLVNFIVRSGKFDISHQDDDLDPETTYVTEHAFVDKYRTYCRDHNLSMGTWNQDQYRTVFEDYKITRKQAILEYDNQTTNAYFLFGIRFKQQND